MRLMIFLLIAYLNSNLRKILSAKKELTQRKFNFIKCVFSWDRVRKEDFKNLILAVIIVILLGFTDYLTGYEISFSIFFFIPIVFITYIGPATFGIAVSVLSALAWGVADLISGHRFSNLLIPIWNTFMRFMIFTYLVYLLSRLKYELGGERELRKYMADFFGRGFGEREAKNGTFVNLIGALIAIILLGFTDYLTGYEISFSVFYLIPILFIAWFESLYLGIMISILSATVWGMADLISGHHYSNLLIPFWNTAMRLTIFISVVYPVWRLRKALSLEKELSERKSVFVANVSHELKNPLAVIRESIALILDGHAGEIDKEKREILKRGHRCADRLIRLVSDLLDVSQIEAGKMKLKNEKLDPSALVDEVLITYEREILNKGLTFRKEVQPDIGMLWGDCDKLTEVVINLLNNAIKYTPSGSITIRLKGNVKEIRFEITDTGPGIPPEYREKIFDKFERVLAEKQEGTGLGLSIAKDIVVLHGGKIWVESESGKGSVFIFILPRKPAIS